MSKYSEALKRIEELESRCICLELYASQLKKENVRIEELEQKNKVLVDVLRVYDYGFDGNTIFRCGWFYTDECMKIVDWRKQLFKDYNINEDDFKAMLELVEVRE